MTIARHFNAGLKPQRFLVPQGRPDFQNKKIAMVETLRRPITRPGGTGGLPGAQRVKSVKAE
jgi:hypothetical protein